MHMDRTFRLGAVAIALTLLMGAGGAQNQLLLKRKVQQIHPVVVKPVVTQAAVPTVPKVVSKMASATAPASITPASAPPASTVLVPGKPVLLALTGDWSVFAADLNGSRTCYSATQPKDTVPRSSDRLPAYVYLTTKSASAISHELTIKLGIAARGDGVVANVDGHDFKLLAKGDVAYPPDAKTDADLLFAMRHGHTMMLHTALSSGAGAIVDSISLLGVDDSLRMIDRACIGATASR